MKTTILSAIAFMAMVTTCFAQNKSNLPPINNGMIEYTEVIENGLTKEAMYNNLKSWAAGYFSSAKGALELDDKENGKVIYKARYETSFSAYLQNRGGILTTLIQVDIKDNKYRYIIRSVDYNEKQTESLTIADICDIAQGKKKTMTNNKSYATKQLNSMAEIMEGIAKDLKTNIVISDDF